METKNRAAKAKILSAIGGMISIISVFLPWFSASANTGAGGITSGISVNGLGFTSGSGMLLGLVGEKAGWEFQGIGVLALGIVSIAVAIILRQKIQGIAMLVCGVLIIGGGVANLLSIGEFSGEFLGATIHSGAGYGLYLVIIAGATASVGGLIALRDLR